MVTSFVHRYCCKSVLKKATDGQTIAIPALGTGIYGIPYDVSAASLVTETDEFLQENPSHTLKEVHFVDNDPTAIEALMKEMSTRFKHDMNFHINDLVRDRWSSLLGAASVTPPMEIRLTIGNIAKSTVRYSNSSQQFLRFFFLYVAQNHIF